MATVYPNSEGQWHVQFTGLGGKRQTIYLGKLDKRFAEEFGRRVESLLEATHLGRPPEPLTLHWLAELSPKFKRKLAKLGFAVVAPAATIEQLVQHCLASAANLEPATIVKYQDAEANLVAFFGADRSLQQITPGDADAFRAWLLKHGRRPKPGPLAPITVSKRVQQARQFFSAAVDNRWVLNNPFAKVKCPIEADRSRERFIERDVVAKLMAAADPELRLMIALGRYLGLRVPSELWPLEWEWVNWDAGQVKVLDWKRKRYPKYRWRFPPLFPEVRGLLAEAHETRGGSAKIFPASGVTGTAIRNRLERLCVRCEILPWPKIWQNLRSTRETELVDEGFPMHVVCAWIGNSPAVAMDHYLQITKEHRRRATGGDCNEMQRWTEKGGQASA